MGLATGLENIFDDRIAHLVLEWFTRELHLEVRQRLTDHLVRQSEKSPAYKEHAIQEFERSHPGSPLRERMLATAAGTPMFSILSLIQYNTGSDLLGGLFIMDNRKTTVNIGSVQAGAVAIDGDATNSGATSNYNTQTLEMITIEAERRRARNQGKPSRQ